MSYELLKPYTDKQRADFVCLHQGLNPYENETGFYFLEANEIVIDGEIVINPNYEQEQEQKEAERINNLTMTALDFIGFLQQCGLTLEQINAYLEANLPIKTQLTYCQNVFCGVAKALMPITFGEITITADMVEQAFKIKNGETVTMVDVITDEETEST